MNATNIINALNNAGYTAIDATVSAAGYKARTLIDVYGADGEYEIYSALNKAFNQPISSNIVTYNAYGDCWCIELGAN